MTVDVAGPVTDTEQRVEQQVTWTRDHMLSLAVSTLVELVTPERVSDELNLSGHWALEEGKKGGGGLKYFALNHG